MNLSQVIKTDLLPKLRARYERRSRAGKTRMLDELCADHGYERKYAIKLLRATVPAPSGRPHPGPEPRYTLIEPVVRTIWLAAEQPCGKRLAPARAAHPLRGRCGTKPGSLLKTEIPIRTGTWDVTRPGCLEADSVARCGTSLAGDFMEPDRHGHCQPVDRGAGAAGVARALRKFGSVRVAGGSRTPVATDPDGRGGSHPPPAGRNPAQRGD